MALQFTVFPTSSTVVGMPPNTDVGVSMQITLSDPANPTSTATAVWNNAVLPPNSDFTLPDLPGLPVTMTAGQTLYFTVHILKPPGTYTTVLTLTTSLGSFKVPISVTFEQSTEFKVTPTTFLFPGTVVNSASAPQPFVVTNTTTGSITINPDVLFSNPDFSLATALPPAGVTLGPGQSTTLEVQVLPTVSGLDSGTMTVYDAHGGFVVTMSVVGLLFIEVNALQGKDYEFLLGFGGQGTSPLPGTVTVSPGSISLSPGATQQFSANVQNLTSTAVTWTVDQGSIDASGLYTAPNVSTATTATVTATSVVNATVTGTASISIQPAAVISVTVLPITAVLTSGQTLQFSASVHNSVNQAVTWVTTQGTISASGLYIAPTVSASASVTVSASSLADPSKSDAVTVTVNPPAPAQLDLLEWTTLNTRTTQHLAGDPSAPYEVQWLSTDAGYPSNYPVNTLWFIKNKLGNPWDVLRYDANHISHWWTENDDAPYQAQCQAANGTTCWLYAKAYKRNLTAGGIHIMPRLFTPGDTVTIDNPAPNNVVRTADCEATSDQINLGSVRGITTGPFKISWGGSIDHGTGTLANGPNYDSVNGVDTIKNQYCFTVNASQPTGYADVEETYYVLGFGRVAWYYYHNGVFQQKTVNTTVVSGGRPAPNFPCGPGKPWFL